MCYAEHTVEEAYIPRSWFDDVVSDLEAKQSYLEMIDQLQEDWNAQHEWREEYAASA